MPRIRYLKPDFFKDDDLAELPYETRIFYAGLWCFADREGRLENRLMRLKVEIFPYDKVDIAKCLQQLSSPKKSSGKPFIQIYSNNGQQFIQIINWERHQKPHHTEKSSIIPPAPPLMEKGMEKGMGNEHEASKGIENGEITVKEPLSADTKKFTPPTIDEIYTYVNEKKYNVEPHVFWSFYQSKDWFVGKNKMKDWRAAVVQCNAKGWAKKELNVSTDPAKKLCFRCSKPDAHMKVVDKWFCGSDCYNKFLREGK